MSNQSERLKKLYALALGGVGGEKENAAALLEKLANRYGIDIEELDAERVRDYEFEYHGDIQRKLLVQTVYKVLGSVDTLHSFRYTHSGRKYKTRLGASCTEAQKIEIEFLFSFYTELFEREQQALLRAFIAKHDIYGELKPGEEPEPQTAEELLKMAALMNGLSDESPRLQIEEGLRHE